MVWRHSATSRHRHCRKLYSVGKQSKPHLSDQRRLYHHCGKSVPHAVKLAFSVQPSNAVTQATITPAVQVSVEDGSGNLVTTATNPVTLALVGGTGLAGTLTATPKNGVATFSNLTISTAGTYTLSASSPSLTSATSTSFTISTSTSAATGCIDNITSYGAVGNGSTDNTTAINKAFAAAAAASPKCSVEIPAGTFNYSNQLNMNGITVFGLGSTSILNSTNTNASAITMQGSGPSLSNLVILGTGTTRTAGSAQSMIWVQNASNFTVNNILIDGGSCTGVWDNGSSNGVIENVTVHNTLADSITNTNGANNVTVQNNLVYNSGDDGYSNNSYSTDSNQVNNITEKQNTFLSGNARGMECSGCKQTTFTGNYIDNTSGYSDIWIASEDGAYVTQAVSAITVTGNTLVHGGPNQGAIEYWSTTSGQNSISNVTVNGNQWYNTTTFTANQVTGNGTLSGITIQNNNAYINPVSFGSAPSNCTGCSFTNNTTYAPSAYPGAIAPPLGGTVPIFSLPSGTYKLPQTLTLDEVTSGDTMSYCTVGSGTCTPSTTYGGAITISTPEVVCAMGTNSSSTIPVPSVVVCTTYNGGGQQAATPTFSPTSGTSFSPTLSVSMSDTTPSSSTYYTSGSTATITTNYTSTITGPSGVVVENNTDYSTGQFTNSSNPNSTATETGNQVLAPSAYTTLLVPSFVPAAVATSPDSERGRL